MRGREGARALSGQVIESATIAVRIFLSLFHPISVPFTPQNLAPVAVEDYETSVAMNRSFLLARMHRPLTHQLAIYRQEPYQLTSGRRRQL